MFRSLFNRLYPERAVLPWERVNRNSLSQWWGKRNLRYLFVNRGPNRCVRRTQRHRTEA